MKRFSIAALLVAFAVSIAIAAPETVTLKAKNGDVTFSHAGHSAAMECTVCHGAEMKEKLAPMGRDDGHALCLDCHKEKAAGPTRCGECHKK